ncbi:MAG: response regulator transcription factor [bacterium]|nr:response regulator transcription factor [bacterium]
MLSGDLTEALERTGQLMDLAVQIENSYIAAWSSYLMGYIHYAWNDPETACEHFSHAINNRFLLDANAPVDSFAGLALSHQAMQQSAKVGETLDRMKEFAQESQNPGYLTIARSAGARVALLQGDAERTLRRLKTADVSSDAETMFFWLEIPRLTQCRALLAQGTDVDLREAAEKLQGHWQSCKTTHNTPHMIEISLLQALTYQKQGQHDEALAAVERAVTLARPGGWVRPFVELGPEMASLLKRLNARENIATEYISQLLDAFKHEEPGAAPDVSAHDTPTHLSPHNQALLDPLTKRETEILTLLTQRFTNREIAEKLFISPGTAKLHTIKIYRKLDVHSRREAVAKAGEIGLLP